jgi:3-methyladenine DNA glycosylase Tag
MIIKKILKQRKTKKQDEALQQVHDEYGSYSKTVRVSSNTTNNTPGQDAADTQQNTVHLQCSFVKRNNDRRFHHVAPCIPGGFARVAGKLQTRSRHCLTQTPQDTVAITRFNPQESIASGLGD